MATSSSTTLGLENILRDTAEVQLASLNAAIEFWSQWLDRTTRLSQSIESRLDSIKGSSRQPVELLMEMTEVNREYLRELNALPREVASKFVSELDRLGRKDGAATKPAPGRARRARRARTKT